MGSITPSSSPKFRLAICGGGICGFTLASALARFESPDAPIEVHVYEAAKQISTIGAGLLIWPRTWNIIDLLGLEAEAAKISTEPPSDVPKKAFLYRRSDRPGESHNFFELMRTRFSQLHRADLLDVLRFSLPPEYTVHTAKRLTHYTEGKDTAGNPVITLRFADGTTAETDVLVGTDGIKSAARVSMYALAHERDCAQVVDVSACPRCAVVTPQWTGMTIWRCLIPAERLRAVNAEHHSLKYTMSYCGRRKHVVAYPISNGRLVNFIGFVSQPELEGTVYEAESGVPAPKEELLAQFVGWEKEVLELIDCTENLTHWAINCMGSLPFSVSGRVALAGDAVHAKQTHQGAGAGQAMEDAFLLGRLLAHPHTTLERVADVFKIHQETRLKFTQEVARVSRLTGKMVQLLREGFPDGDLAEGEEEAQLAELARGIEELWEWQEAYRAQEQWEKAEEELVRLA